MPPATLNSRASASCPYFALGTTCGEKGTLMSRLFSDMNLFVIMLKVLPTADNSCFRESFRLPETSRHTLCSKSFPEAALEIVAYGTLQRKRMNMLICCGRCSATSLAILATSPNANYAENRCFSLSLYVAPSGDPEVATYQTCHSFFHVYAHQR